MISPKYPLNEILDIYPIPLLCSSWKIIVISHYKCLKLHETQRRVSSTAPLICLAVHPGKPKSTCNQSKVLTHVRLLVNRWIALVNMFWYARGRFWSLSPINECFLEIYARGPVTLASPFFSAQDTEPSQIDYHPIRNFGTKFKDFAAIRR